MRTRPSALRFGAVALAVVLAGSYVWFRGAQAGEKRARLLPGSKAAPVELKADRSAAADPATAPTTEPATEPPMVLPGSKSFALELAKPVRHENARAQPATTQASPLPATQP